MFAAIGVSERAVLADSFRDNFIASTILTVRKGRSSSLAACLINRETIASNVWTRDARAARAGANIYFGSVRAACTWGVVNLVAALLPESTAIGGIPALEAIIIKLKRVATANLTIIVE